MAGVVKSTRVTVTVGDINGIGLEAFLKAIVKLGSKSAGFYFDIIGNIKSIKEYISKCSLNDTCLVKGNQIIVGNTNIGVIGACKYAPVEFGRESSSAGHLAVESIEKAYELLAGGKYHAMLTLPISKHSIHMAGAKFPGHTEMLAELSNSSNPLMILFSGRFRVALATVHIPLKDVAKALTKKLITDKAMQFYKSLKQDFGIPQPKIAVLGLNPHAGEDGDIGEEEIKIIKPAVKSLINKGIDIVGPFPADGFFGRKMHRNFDGVLAMYHDQGLIPLKLAASGGVNFTAGLPVIRTSPDHGTAFSLAGKGIADLSGTLNAILAAGRIYNARRKYYE